MRIAKKENMGTIVSEIVKNIEVGKLVSIRELMKKVNVSSPAYLESMLQVISAYHLAEINSMLQSKEKDEVLEYAEKLLVPQVEYCKGVGSVVKKVPLINIMRENAIKRSEKIENYLKGKSIMVESEPEEKLVA